MHCWVFLKGELKSGPIVDVLNICIALQLMKVARYE